MGKYIFFVLLIVCVIARADDEMIPSSSDTDKHIMLVDAVLGPDPLAATEALVTVLNNEETILETAEPIIRGIYNAPNEITIQPPFDDITQTGVCP